MLLELLCTFEFDSVNNSYLERAMFSIQSINISLEEVNAQLLKNVEAKSKPEILNKEDASKFANLELLFENIVE